MLDSKSRGVLVLTGPIGLQSFFTASVSYMGSTYCVEKVPGVGTLPSQASPGWRDGEIYPASLAITQRPGMTRDSDKWYILKIWWKEVSMKRYSLKLEY